MVCVSTRSLSSKPFREAESFFLYYCRDSRLHFNGGVSRQKSGFPKTLDRGKNFIKTLAKSRISCKIETFVKTEIFKNAGVTTNRSDSKALLSEYGTPLEFRSISIFKSGWIKYCVSHLTVADFGRGCLSSYRLPIRADSPVARASKKLFLVYSVKWFKINTMWKELLV